VKIYARGKGILFVACPKKNSPAGFTLDAIDPFRYFCLAIALFWEKGGMDSIGFG